MFSYALACGPYFSETGLLASLALFLVIKPLAYFAFIQAYRYRVSRPIPMPMQRAVGLAAMRAGLGLGFTGVGALLLWSTQSSDLLVASWIYLYAERLFSWWYVGWRGAGVRGWRLVGWVLYGTFINVAFDIAVVWGLIDGWMPAAIVTCGIAAFIWVLHAAGRRQSLRNRYAAKPACRTCDYDLTGNLSGQCPECGTPIETAAQLARPISDAGPDAERPQRRARAGKRTRGRTRRTSRKTSRRRVGAD